ncbi:hypothetical protein NP233_g11250 [Leucocoprinus birnbaumii]|uniref:Uncharacterized protein n=1 Tax=Leucocoprinus birnbaumii TaxID=56174 RepID=A0AAD5VGS4_9AGAR|nr:hypothetical protein NP233_g11250 [Leucocoprinus birnbaumii]
MAPPPASNYLELYLSVSPKLHIMIPWTMEHISITSALLALLEVLLRTLASGLALTVPSPLRIEPCFAGERSDRTAEIAYAQSYMFPQNPYYGHSDPLLNSSSPLRKRGGWGMTSQKILANSHFENQNEWTASSNSNPQLPIPSTQLAYSQSLIIMLRFIILALSLTTVFGTPRLLPRDEAILLTDSSFSAITLSATRTALTTSKNPTGLSPLGTAAAILSILKLVGSTAAIPRVNGVLLSQLPGAKKTKTALGTLPAMAAAAEYLPE